MWCHQFGPLASLFASLLVGLGYVHLAAASALPDLRLLTDSKPADIEPPPSGDRSCMDYGPIKNQASSASPLVDDCWRIIDNISRNGNWTVLALGPAGQRTLVKYGTCALGVTVKLGKCKGWAYIANWDLIWVIKNSIWFHAWEGKVGTKGWWACQPTWMDCPVEWGIYHTK